VPSATMIVPQKGYLLSEKTTKSTDLNAFMLNKPMNKLLAFVPILAILICCDLSFSEDLDAISEIPKRELLLLEDIPVVITPSKVAQTIMDSPSTITVLTQEDIKRYGAVSLSDMLRNVPGVDVMSISPTDRNISMRGFNHLASGRILSMVDSHPVYVDFYGMSTWELFPLSRDEIERIEIVKGPGSALYGASAFDGVVNIITDSSAKPSTDMTVRMDQRNKLSGSIMHRGKSGELSYRTTLGYDKISGWSDELADSGENKLFNGSLKYGIDTESFISVSAYAHEYKGDLIVSSNLKPSEHRGNKSALNIDYIKSNLKCGASWRHFTNNSESKELLSPDSEDISTDTDDMASEFPSYRIDSDALDFEIQHSFEFWNRNFVIWGLNYRFNYVDSDLLDTDHSQNIVSGYIQDQFNLAEPLNITTGLRYDRHPLTDNNFSPRCSVVYSPMPNHAIRASAGRAYRNPSFVYSYLSLDFTKTAPPIPVITALALKM